MIAALFASILSIALPAPAPPPQAAPEPMLYGSVSVNTTHVAFSVAGDIWVVDRKGGEARRLTSDPASEDFPSFSPDGRWLAFSRQVGGTWNVFVVPTTGGEARQLTVLPENDAVRGWTPDGRRILFMTHRDEEGVYRLYTVAADGSGLPEMLPLPQAYAGSYSADGRRIAYTPTQPLFEWRHYRGGWAGKIWIADLATGTVERLPHKDTNDLFPIWSGNTIYYLSDPKGTQNLFAYDVGSKQVRQLTSHAGYGIRSLSAGGGAIAYVQDGRIHLFDIASGKTAPLDVRVTLDRAELAPRTVNAARTLEWAAVSPNGDRLVFGARGEVLVHDPATKATRNLTGTSGAAERFPVFSPDGRSIAYVSDESGEYQLHIQPADGSGPARKISIEQNPSFYRELVWSPDGTRIALTDKRLSIWVVDVAKGAATRVDTSPYFYQEEFFPAWSPDGRWLTWSRHLPNRVRTIFVYDTRSGELRQVTDGVTHTQSPVFDRNGKYLYFVSSPNAGTSEYGWGVLKGIFARPLVVRSLHAYLLQQGTPAPLLPTREPNPDANVTTAATEVRIDFEGLADRVIDLPLPARDFGLLVPGAPGVLFAQAGNWPEAPGDFGADQKQTLYRIDLSAQPKLEVLLEDAPGFEISRDGSHVLYAAGPEWRLVPTTAPPRPDEGKLDPKAFEIQVDPAAEWRQMYHEAWRLMRHWFYDPKHHGLDLAGLERHYAAYLPNVTRRDDLNTLMRMMLGHVSVSHLGVGGGDVARGAPPSRIGLLGADYAIDGNRYRFAKVFRSGGFDSPMGTVTAPLDYPGSRVADGEYLIAVDGENVDTSRSVYTWFVGKAGRPTKLTVGPNADGTGSRTVTVVPLSGENTLRRADWARRNRAMVEKMSGGRLGYVYVSNYGPSIMDFIRGLTGYSDRAGIVIDQRFNGGGITPDYLIEWLQRRPLYYYTFREGADIATPVNPSMGESVLIVNELNGSAAETFAFMYELADVGATVGTRTIGGGIGPSVYTPRLIDGGRISIPNRAAYNPDGTSWGIENVGVAPDVEVEITPKDFMEGRDPQLERAVQLAMERIDRAKPVAPRKPPYPVHP